MGSMQHFRLGDPFSEQNLPRYSLVGDVDIPLNAIFESRAQEFSLDVTSPHTQSVVGIIRLAIEPSDTESRTNLKFNVRMKDMIGFAEREGTEVHAQLFIPGVSEEGGATTTTMVSGFDEGPIRFDSLHTMSMPLGRSPRNHVLRVAVFSKIMTMHLEKLISWDDIRDHSTRTSPRKKAARLNENEFYTEERHDVFARAQMLELSESGEYLPVQVIQQSDVDPGAFQLHQGLQRRVQLSLTHSSGEALQWLNVYDIRIGSVRLQDPRGKIPDLSSPTKEVHLSTILGPVVKSNPDGTSTVTVVAQWDSSLHNSIYLDRTTADKYRVQMCVRWNVDSQRLSEPINFSLDVAAQIQPRVVRSQNKFMQLWNNNRIVHASIGLYQLVIRPAAARRAGDLWRMNTLHRYVKGEEYLAGWTPRGVSLVRDFIAAQKKKLRMSEVENAKGFLSSLPTTRNVTPLPPPSSTFGRDTPSVTGSEYARSVVAPDRAPIITKSIENGISVAAAAAAAAAADTSRTNGNADIQPDETEAAPSEADVDDEAQPSPPASEPASTPSPSPRPDQQPSPSNELELPISPSTESAPPEIEDPSLPILRKFVSLWSSTKDPSEVYITPSPPTSPHTSSHMNNIPANKFVQLNRTSS